MLPRSVPLLIVALALTARPAQAQGPPAPSTGVAYFPEFRAAPAPTASPVPGERAAPPAFPPAGQPGATTAPVAGPCCEGPMVCAPVPDKKKTTKTVHWSKVETYCVPGCSWGGLFKWCGGCQGGCGPTSCKLYQRHVLMKRVVEEECEVMTCKPVPAVCVPGCPPGCPPGQPVPGAVPPPQFK